MSLMTRPPASIGGCQSTLLEKLVVSLSQYHHTMVHIANHLGMNSRPVEAAVLRREFHPIIANLPIHAFLPVKRGMHAQNILFLQNLYSTVYLSIRK
jgi:hypothetical protein